MESYLTQTYQVLNLNKVDTQWRGRCGVASFLTANCFNLIKWHYWSIQMKTNRVWGSSWLLHLQKVPAVHRFQAPQLNRRNFHGPLESHTSTTLKPVNPHPSNGPCSLHSFTAGNDFFGPGMCTERDRVKLIHILTLSADYINIDACAATCFYFLLFLFLLCPILVYSWCSKNARKQVHSSSHVINMTARAMMASICFTATIPTLWLTMSQSQIKTSLMNYKYTEYEYQTDMHIWAEECWNFWEN